MEEEISITTDSSGRMNDQRSESVGSSDRKNYLIDLFECEVIVSQLLLMALHEFNALPELQQCSMNTLLCVSAHVHCSAFGAHIKHLFLCTVTMQKIKL